MVRKKRRKEREREWWYIGIKEGATWMERREEGAKKKGKRVFKSMNFLFLAIKITSAV